MSLPTLPATPPGRVEANNRLNPSGDSIGQPSAAGEFTFTSGVAVLKEENGGKGAPCELAWSEIADVVTAVNPMATRSQALLRVMVCSLCNSRVREVSVEEARWWAGGKILSGEFRGNPEAKSREQPVMSRFGTFELDSQRRQLRRGEQNLHLTPKAFDLLSILVDTAPRVVPKSELHQRLWRAGVVTDATLVGLVKEIRRVLADTDPQKPLIRTAHRVGYALEAPVTRAPHAPRLSHWLIVGERRIALTDGENIIGRDPDVNVWLDFATVSRRHARIVVTSARTVLEDLASKNGTSVGGTPVAAPFTLRDGDWIAFGQVVLTYRRSDRSQPTVTQASRIESVRL
jgi:DNA-binding winged helix-turn-helix (wHTH) protein